jgi:aspartyl-tRNA(Asn)/glutamyl-tRNA(Gln) amidotransferase subunit C
VSAISEDDVRHVAMLARLGLDDARVRALKHDLTAILDHMDVLRGVETDGVPEFGISDTRGMPLRADAAAPTRLSPSPTDMAPESRDGFFLVPRLSTHDGAAQDREP